jgi:2-polyprenyl-3-methyl-5-hydroxy-6-metoxy-1,4-benzoquinol methylase
MGSQATEQHDLETAVARLPDIERRLGALLRRLSPHVRLAPGARVLDVGAAQGLTVVAFHRAGFDAAGLEPWAEAVQNSRAVAAETAVEFDMVEGYAESMPFESASFDLVHAQSVMEHVRDPAAVFAESHRVLRPGGALYFHTSNALCPRQPEIRGFPCFSWYPQPLKRRILDWATAKRPALVGHTTMPAYNWYTPWGVRSALARAGFSEVLDRWELRHEDELAGWRGSAVRAAKRSRAVRVAGDVAIPQSAYLAIK